MAIILYSDFGSNDLYVGQVEAVLERHAPGVRVIHLLHDAPAFDVESSAHLLAALSHTIARGHVVMGVVDPGVGSDRGALVVRADGLWFVGPDNGLFSVIAARAAALQCWQITAVPACPSFHGRDLFALTAADVANGDFPNDRVRPVTGPKVVLGSEDLAAIVYIDHYGNAFTGLRAAGVPPDVQIRIGDRTVPHARVFSSVLPGDAFWYENSVGLVEIAVNRGHAAATLGLAVGDPVSIEQTRGAR